MCHGSIVRIFNTLKGNHMLNTDVIIALEGSLKLIADKMDMYDEILAEYPSESARIYRDDMGAIYNSIRICARRLVKLDKDAMENLQKFTDVDRVHNN
tara:strand:- start:656 stop:949 length:294 start_codon:yes stop_codon:yes gene_type:complete